MEASERIQTERADWLTTASGRTIYILDPRPDDFTIEDIAHGLSMVCRFGGQLLDWYCVAQHSLLVAEIAGELAKRDDRDVIETQRFALLHDAAEAYLGDVISPLKAQLKSYRGIERAFMDAILTRFDIRPSFSIRMLVKRADRIALATERRDLCPPPTAPWVVDEVGVEPHPAKVFPYRHTVAREMFLRRWDALLQLSKQGVPCGDGNGSGAGQQVSLL